MIFVKNANIIYIKIGKIIIKMNLRNERFKNLQLKFNTNSTESNSKMVFFNAKPVAPKLNQSFDIKK